MNFQKIKNFIESKWDIIWICFISTILAFLFTSNSPFYHFDKSSESTVFTVIGHSWLVHGMIPYKTLFTNSGPLQLLIFGIGSLIKFHYSYIGIFIIEAIVFSITSAYYYKSVKLYIKSDKVSILLTTLIQLVYFASILFVLSEERFTKNVLLIQRGGTTEEFCLPFISIIMYYVLRVIKFSGINFTKFEWILIGCLPALMFFIEFHIAILFIVLLFAYIIYLFINNKVEFKKSLLYGVSSFIIPFIIFIAYFKFNGALSEFITYYFKINVFNINELNIPFRGRLLEALNNGFYMIYTNYILLITFVVSLLTFVFTNKLSKFVKIFFLVVIFCLFEVSLLPGKPLPQYLLPVLPIILLGLIFIVPSNIDKYLSDSFVLKLIVAFVVVTVISLAFANDQFDNSRIGELQNLKVNNTVEMANIIKKDKQYSSETTILNLSNTNLDLYTLTNTKPSVKFFYRPSMKVELYDTETLKAINENKINYIYAVGASKKPWDKRWASIRLLDIVDKKLRKQYRKALKKYKLIYKKQSSDKGDKKMYYLLKKVK